MQRYSLGRLVPILCMVAIACGAALAAAQMGAKKTDPTLLAKGQYLVQIMSCGDCHTPGAFYGAPDAERALSGSEMGWKGPWGVRYAANLTPDLDTGIGYWTAAELAKTLRTGIRPDGSQIGAPMPVQNIMQLSPEDADAIAAFVMSRKPVSHLVPKAVKPGGEAKGPLLEFPVPSGWDAPRPPFKAPAGEKK